MDKAHFGAFFVILIPVIIATCKNLIIRFLHS